MKSFDALVWLGLTAGSCSSSSAHASPTTARTPTSPPRLRARTQAYAKPTSRPAPARPAPAPAPRLQKPAPPRTPPHAPPKPTPQRPPPRRHPRRHRPRRLLTSPHPHTGAHPHEHTEAAPPPAHGSTTAESPTSAPATSYSRDVTGLEHTLTGTAQAWAPARTRPRRPRLRHHQPRRRPRIRRPQAGRRAVRGPTEGTLETDPTALCRPSPSHARPPSSCESLTPWSAPRSAVRRMGTPTQPRHRSGRALAGGRPGG